MIKLPLFKIISSDTYTGAFIMGSLFASFTACTALAFAMIHKKKVEKCNHHKSLFCLINKHNMVLTIINIFFKTMIITFFLSFILFVFFGFGGGSLNNYYKPEISAIKNGLIYIVLLLFIYFSFNFLVAHLYTKGNKNKPSFYHIFKTTLYNLDVIQKSPCNAKQCE